MSDILEQTKQAAAARELDVCLEHIRAENPDHWPFGLKVAMFRRVHPVEKAGDLAGFVGWQTVKQSGKSVGYYSVGILPEFRRQGLAKQACRRLIDTYGSGVDEVHAMIADGNEPSVKLAKHLGVTVDSPDAVKQAGFWSEVGTLLRRDGMRHLVGAGVGTGIGALENRTTLEGLSDENKHINLLLNALGGAGFAHAKANPVMQASIIGGLPVKEMALKGLNSYEKDAPLRHATSVLENEAAKHGETAAALKLEQAQHMTPQDWLLAGGLGLGGLGLGTYMYNSFKGKTPGKATTKLQDDAKLRHKSKLKIEIPADAVDKSFYEQLSGLTGKPAAAQLESPVKEASHPHLYRWLAANS